ncbi:S26 family signal peptidase [Paracrocinitomix mangrovi]|uniref:S26 family signal peptidase n=1 Tax=Paracrocinitomix mangrovi TaxID=2862509 RepID=UPI001C8E3EAD|nr:S26 family signal peptidase [Paracrocinitomix mangrovi]UKN01633.1 S26 family signal peptidase [Paracrocinitomix mangrovi]
MGYLGLLIGYLIIFLTPVIGMWHKRFADLGLKPSTAFIPFFNYYQILKATKHPKYWVIFLIFPYVQFYMWASLNITYIRKFGEFGVKETILGILFPFPVFINIANKTEKYQIAQPTNWDVAKQVSDRMPSDHVALFFALPIVGHVIALPFQLAGFKRKAGKKSIIKEWGDAIIFALVAASVIRTYVFEPYKIPTGSMEKTLLVGDQLFVDKLTYGPRVPMTPFSFPIFHNMDPFLHMQTYSTIQTIPYTRLPGFRSVDRNDVVVFNFPAGDTAINDPRMPYGLIGHNYHAILRDEAYYICRFQEGKSLEYFEDHYNYYIAKARDQFENEGVIYNDIAHYDTEIGKTEFNGLLSRPVDKKENYIKRCVATPGDEIEIIDKELYVNGKLAFQAENMQYNYTLTNYPYPRSWSEPQEIYFKKTFDAGERELNATLIKGDSNRVHWIAIPMTKKQYNKVKGGFPELLNYSKPKGYYTWMLEEINSDQYYPVFPSDPQYDWTEDNFGPLRIPKKGDIVSLTKKSIPLYRRIIHAYEGHELEEKADGIYIDGEKTEQYTIEMDYYWMMGDNRNGSLDSRFWGFVPVDHIVGHAAFTWLSVDQEKGMFGGGMRWSRMFNKIE